MLEESRREKRIFLRRNEWESVAGMHGNEGGRRSKEWIKDKEGSREEERKEMGNFVSSLGRG